MTIIQHRKDTEANWFSENPILENGEIGLETDTRRVKIGDGETHWRDLPYLVKSKISEMTDDVGLAKIIDIPQKTSQLINDSGFQNETQVQELIAETTKGYTHTQAVASDTWTITHNLGKRPNVIVEDSDGKRFYPPVEDINENTCIIHLLGATTGTAYLN